MQKNKINFKAQVLVSTILFVLLSLLFFTTCYEESISLDKQNADYIKGLEKARFEND